MALLTVILSLPNLLIATFFKKKLEKNQSFLIYETNLSVSKVQDLTEGILDWKISDSSQNVNKIFDKRMSKLLKEQVKVEKFQYLITSLNQLFSNSLYFGTWLVGGFFIITGNLTIGSMIAFSQLLVRIAYPVYASSDLLSQYISGKKVLDTLKTEFSVESKGIEIAAIENIHFQDFIIHTSDDNKLLTFDFQFLKGNKYLLRGKSGSGKSTILKTIIKENNKYEGSVEINDVNINQLNEASIFKNIAYIAQNPYIFEASMRENITLFAENYTDEQIFEVLEFVELSKWANNDSLNFHISKENMKLSGGEAKRIALARALLTDKSFLILDEFSSGIDLPTLIKLEEKLLKLNKTVIYVTHIETPNLNQFQNIIDLDQLSNKC